MQGIEYSMFAVAQQAVLQWLAKRADERDDADAERDQVNAELTERVRQLEEGQL